MIRSLAAQLRLGRLVYQAYHRPVGLVRQSVREGGPWAQAQDRAGHAAMQLAAARLPPLSAPPIGPAAEIAFLSGPKYWHQTLFCFVSLQLQLPFRITPVIYDDGAMDRPTEALIRRVVPWARFVNACETEQLLDALLPEDRFPALRGRRRGYPHLRKLTDIHIGSGRFKLVADSDMLFFRRPDALEHWFAQPDWLYMQDVATAYGYPAGFLAELAGAPVPEAINVGLYAVNGSEIDWDKVEHWCSRQIDEYGPQYVQEQALTAMLFAGRSATVLPRKEYVVMPDRDEGKARSAVLHHYVDVSKRAYFRHNWRQIAALVETAAKTPCARP